MNNATVTALSFNTCNFKFSLIVKMGGLTVHTSVEESQANQIRAQHNLREGVMGKIDSYQGGQNKNTHIVYWQIDKDAEYSEDSKS